MKLVKPFFNLLYRFRPPEAVSYWKRSDHALARVVRDERGALAMQIKDEKYLFPGFPRGHVLLGSLARLKLLIKNSVFNEIWMRLDWGETDKEIIERAKTQIISALIQEIEASRHDYVPSSRMAVPVKEIYRTLTRTEVKYAKTLDEAKTFSLLKQGICHFLQEDDAYRFRLQWLIGYLRFYGWYLKLTPKPIRDRLRPKIRQTLLKTARKVFIKLENAEVNDDMKGRARLIARVGLFFLENMPLALWEAFEDALAKAKWKNFYLSRADKYYFRAKYFKVDHSRYDY